MLIILSPDIDEQSPAYQTTWNHLHQLPGISVRKHLVKGKQQTLTELYLLGETKSLDTLIRSRFRAALQQPELEIPAQPGLALRWLGTLPA